MGFGRLAVGLLPGILSVNRAGNVCQKKGNEAECGMAVGHQFIYIMCSERVC